MRKIIPFGDRMLVRRRTGEETLGEAGILVAPETVKDRKTDIADVICIPDHTFSDKSLIANSETIVESLTEKAKEGDPDAFTALLQFNAYLKIKSIKQGDVVMVGKYVGIDFQDNSGNYDLSLVRNDDIIGIVE